MRMTVKNLAVMYLVYKGSLIVTRRCKALAVWPGKWYTNGNFVKFRRTSCRFSAWRPFTSGSLRRETVVVRCQRRLLEHARHGQDQLSDFSKKRKAGGYCSEAKGMWAIGECGGLHGALQWQLWVWPFSSPTSRRKWKECWILTQCPQYLATASQTVGCPNQDKRQWLEVFVLVLV